MIFGAIFETRFKNRQQGLKLPAERGFLCSSSQLQGGVVSKRVIKNLDDSVKTLWLEKFDFACLDVRRDFILLNQPVE